jgi:hypothetical protein
MFIDLCLTGTFAWRFAVLSLMLQSSSFLFAMLRALGQLAADFGASGLLAVAGK